MQTQTQSCYGGGQERFVISIIDGISQARLPHGGLGPSGRCALQRAIAASVRAQAYALAIVS